ncbi:hypothetical protein PG985_010449 [Apiospora marii]|uniref:NACHT domain-containing protein n=1 Tax=Apiospora marii TaxID=335849 RepID=A0ABR1RZR9_9PEZI
MEALAALGLASNILSFVDFAWKLVAGASEIYASGAGVADDVEFLNKTTRDVKQHSGRIVVVPGATEDLRTMARECDEIAQELLKSLEELRIQGKRTRIKSAQAAFKGFRSKHKMEQLNGKISKVQERISAHMQELLLNEVQGLGCVLAGLHETHVNLGIATKNEIESLKEEVQTALENLEGGAPTIQTEEYYQQRQQQEMDPALATKLSDQMQSLALAMENLKVKAMDTNSNQQLLKRLHFTSISTRERKIEEAHEGTFKWLASPDAQASGLSQCLHFINWLRDGDGVFWIYGKPGSGKSTFMKYVFAQDSVTEHFDHWAEGSRLVKASFYFWYAGHPLQKSLEGLLRTLLFEILRHIPDVIPNIIKDPILTRPFSYNEDWDLDTLFRIYEIILQQVEDVKFCFFIDGLDEFHDEEHRSIRDLTNVLHRLESSGNGKIKLCVASRPWQEFEDVYGQTPSKSLKLEDLTRNDIHTYVSDSFHSHEKFMELRNSDSNYEGLIDEVVNRAQGVFLWVRLVVRQLLEGFTFYKSVQTLRLQLADFPEDLDEFFNHMLNSVSAADRKQAAQILQVAIEADQPRLLIFYHFLNEIILGEAAELDSSHTPLDLNEVSAQSEKMRRQLNGISRGLLEVTSDLGLEIPSESHADTDYFRQKVDFLHRTVRDFLVGSPRAKEFFGTNIDNSTVLSIAVARAAVTQMKFATLSPLDDVSLPGLLDEIFFYTRNAISLKKTESAIDDLLEGAENLYIDIVGEPDWRKQPTFFLGLAAKSGHTSFLEQKLSSELPPEAIWECGDRDSPSSSSTSDSPYQFLKWRHKKTISFLSRLQDHHRNKNTKLNLRDALLNYALTPISKSTAPYIDTVRFLLSNGASPNKVPFKNSGNIALPTIWRQFVLHLEPEQEHDEALRGEYFAITKDLIQSGADIKKELFVLPDSKDSKEESSFEPARRLDSIVDALNVPDDFIRGYFTPDQLKELEMSVPRQRNLFGLLSKLVTGRGYNTVDK